MYSLTFKAIIYLYSITYLQFHCGIKGTVLNWFSSYLSNIPQCITINIYIYIYIYIYIEQNTHYICRSS